LSSAQALGVSVLPLSGDIRDLFVGKTGDARASAKALAGINNRNTMAWMHEALAAARGSDVIIASGLVGFVGLAVAEYLKVPVIGAGMIPLTPTREFPSPFLPPFHAMGWIHRVSHVFTNQMVWLSFRKAFNRARVEVLGLPEQRKLPTTHPMLYGISPTLLSRPADWPDNARMCGQWVQPAGDWTPPVELSQFLEAGPPPIYIGFGSMAGFDAARMQQAIVAALDGRRALFYPGAR
jgi:sterol 3beta-glucosyltransferase